MPVIQAAWPFLTVARKLQQICKMTSFAGKHQFPVRQLVFRVHTDLE